MPNATVKLYAGECNGTAGFKIGNKIFQPNELQEGDHTLDFEYEYGNEIVFTMFGKGNKDTKMKDGEVVKDKYIEIKQITMDFLILKNWQFHTYLWDPYFGKNETKVFKIPTRDNFPIWYMEVTS